LRGVVHFIENGPVCQREDAAAQIGDTTAVARPVRVIVGHMVVDGDCTQCGNANVVWHRQEEVEQPVAVGTTSANQAEGEENHPAEGCRPGQTTGASSVIALANGLNEFFIA
jgi:hypothetical protein